MKSYNLIQFRFIASLLVSVFLVSACSSSSETTTGTNAINDGSTGGSSNEIGDNTGETTGNSESDPSSGGSGIEEPVTTSVTFDITVPEYTSNALQVRLKWGEKELLAAWVVDESWTVTDTLPSNTENKLVVTFNDNNGAIALASFETIFKTGTSASETVQINAEQFNASQWDNDADGVSNLDELIAGTYADENEAPQAVQASLELVPDKTFRITWQPVSGANVYRVLENADGVSGFVQISDDLDVKVGSFDHRVALYERFNARYIVQACQSTGACVDSEPLVVAGTLDQAVGYIKSSNTQATDWFGGSIAFSFDGNTMAIGASGEDSSSAGINSTQLDDSLLSSGAVYLFQRVAGQWLQTSYIKASNPDAQDAFGGAVSLSADGKILAVAAIGESSASKQINGDQADNSEEYSGAVYIFELIDSQWVQTFYIKASNGRRIAYFGRLLSLSGDGTTFVTTGNYTTKGAGDVFYIFDRTGDSWAESSIESNGVTGYFSADGITLSTDGDTLVIGDPRRSPAESELGSAHVYVRSADGWLKQASLRGDNIEKGDLFGFGNSLAISADGNTVAVGARYEAGASTGVNNKDVWNEDASYRAGAVYLFQRNGEQWLQQAYVKAGNTDANDEFGSSISLNGAGDVLVVGAPEEHGAAKGINGDATDNSIPITSANSGDGSGAAYIFTLDNGEWSQRAYVKSSNTEGRDLFGRSVAVSGDGKTLAVGALGEGSSSTGINGNQENNSASFSGAVYIY